MMIRVKIRYFGESTGKVIRFDESIEFHMLLRKIIDKLGVTRGDYDLRKAFQLRLGTDIVLEETNEIEDGDEIVLKRITEKADGETSESFKKENLDDDGGGDSDSTRPTKSTRQDRKLPAESGTHPIKNECDDDIEVFSGHDNDVEVISISSDEDDDSSYDDHTEVEEEYDSSSSEDEHKNEKNCNFNVVYRAQSCKKRKRNPDMPSEPPLEVIMDKRDVPSAPGKSDHESENKSSKNFESNEMEEASMLVSATGKKKSEEEVKQRIIKLLNTGFHDQSNENEAKNAMKLAQRLMRKHNLSQALLLKEREMKNSQNSEDGEVLKGGMVRVRIVNRKTRKPSLLARWISGLTHPVCENFGVSSYHEGRRGVCCAVVFYGIYSNAQLAGYAFKVATERISQMSAEYRPEKCWRNISTKSSRLSYALGIVNGISKDVERNIQMEKEQRKRKLERARLASSRGEAYAESDDEDFDENEGQGTSLVAEDVVSDGNLSHNPLSLNEGSRKVKPDPTTSSISGIDVKKRVEELQKEEEAALVLVEHNTKIAEEVLKEHDIKLSSARKRKAIDFDHRSYKKGVEDSKEIDMNQRAIRDEVKVKVEKS